MNEARTYPHPFPLKGNRGTKKVVGVGQGGQRSLLKRCSVSPMAVISDMGQHRWPCPQPSNFLSCLTHEWHLTAICRGKCSTRFCLCRSSSEPSLSLPLSPVCLFLSLTCGPLRGGGTGFRSDVETASYSHWAEGNSNNHTIYGIHGSTELGSETG